MKTKKQITNKLFTGNCLKILKSFPSNIIDLGITSPPYNKQEKQKGWLVKNVVYSDYQDKLPENEYQNNQVEVLDEIWRTTKPGGSFFYNHKIRWDRGNMFHPIDWLRKTKWTIKQEIIWDRTIAANIRGWRFWQVEERIYWLYKPINNNKIGLELASKDAKLTSIWKGFPETKNPHPAPFPLWIPARIIISLLRNKRKAIILDPYIGSGTTAVATKLLGFDYVGIDLSINYIKEAKNRLKHAENEHNLIEKENSFHKVETTFKQRKENKKINKIK